MFYLNEFKVVFRHDRADLAEQSKDIETKAENGSTICVIFNIDTDSLVSWGWHTCQKQSCFNKNSQRKEALKHAIQKYDRELRTQFWYAYFEKRNGKRT